MSLFVIILAVLGLVCLGVLFMKKMISVTRIKQAVFGNSFASLALGSLLVGSLGLSWSGSIPAISFLLGGLVAGVSSLSYPSLHAWLKKAIVLWAPLLGFGSLVWLAGTSFYLGWLEMLLGFGLIAGLVLFGLPQEKESHNALALSGTILTLLLVTHMQFPLIFGTGALLWGVPLFAWFVLGLLLATSVWMWVIRFFKITPEALWFAPGAFLLSYIGIFGLLMMQVSSLDFKHLLFLYTLGGSALGGLWMFLSPIKKWGALIGLFLVISVFDTVAALVFVTLGFLISLLILSYKTSVTEGMELLISWMGLILVVWMFQGNVPQYLETPLFWISLLVAWQAPVLYQWMLHHKIPQIPASVSPLLIVAGVMWVLSWLGTASFVLPFLLFVWVLTLARLAGQKTVMSPLFVFVLTVLTVWMQRFFV